jgi:hypothetical protein
VLVSDTPNLRSVGASYRLLLLLLANYPLIYVIYPYVLQKRGSRVLLILSRDDAQFGITLSHVSDIVGSVSLLSSLLFLYYIFVDLLLIIIILCFVCHRKAWYM